MLYPIYQIDWLSADILETLFSAGFGLIGVLVFARMWAYIRGELKTAPSVTKYQQASNTASAIIFSLIVAVTVVLLVALISSSIAVNALFAVEDEQTVWNEAMIRTLQFPRFVPIALMIVTAFAFLYPIYEYIQMARPSSEGATEIQRWVENNFIKRTDPPWSYIGSVILYIVVIVGVPLGLSLYAVYLSDWATSTETILSPMWVGGLIFFSWLMTGPIMYLSYYSQIGTAHIFFKGIKTDMKKDRYTALYFFIAIISILSAINSFFQYIPIIWGDYPDATINHSELQPGVVERGIELIMGLIPTVTPEMWAQWELFSAIIPIDFLMFFISTIGFGLLGFYNKFLRREPLNRPLLVLFAAYLFIGLGFTIFVNAMIKWPWIFPGQELKYVRLYLNLEVVSDQAFMIRILSPTLLVEKIMNIVFLVWFLFFNKDIRRNADEVVLNEAINNQDMKLVAKYRNHKNPEMRLLVAKALLNEIKFKDTILPSTLKYISQILNDMMMDKDAQIREMIHQNLYDVALKLEPNVIKVPFKSVLESDDTKNIHNMMEILSRIFETNLDRFKVLFQIIIEQSLSEPAKRELFLLLQDIGKKKQEFIVELVLPLLDNPQPTLILGCLSVIKYLILEFETKYANLEDALIKLLNHSEVKVTASAIDVYSTLAAKKEEFRPRFLEVFQKIDPSKPEIAREKLGAIIKLITIAPDIISDLSPQLEALAKNPDPIVQSDLALGLGSITIAISLDQYYEVVFPQITQLIANPNPDVRIGLISTLFLIAKSRPEIFQEVKFRELLRHLFIDKDPQVRKKTLEFIVNQDPLFYLEDINAILKMTDLDLPIRFEILDFLSLNAEKIAPNLALIDLSQSLFAQKMNQELAFTNAEIFGFKEVTSKISIQTATICVLYDFIRFYPQFLDTAKDFLLQNLKTKDDLANAKKLAWIGKSVLAQPNEMDNALILMWQSYMTGSYCQAIICDNLCQFYQKSPEIHAKLFEFAHKLCDLKQDLLPEAKTSLLILMGSIIGHHPEIYFIKSSFTDLNGNERKYDGFKDVFSNFMRFCLEDTNSIIQTGIIESLKQLLNAQTESKKILDFIINSIKKARKDTAIITGLNALLSLPIDLEDTLRNTTLLRLLKKKNPQIVRLAIMSLGKIILAYPTFEEKKYSKEYFKLKNLLYSTLYRQYSTAKAPVVKMAILDQLYELVIKQPHMSMGRELAKAMVLDPDTEVAIKAVNVFTKYLQNKTQLSKDDLNYLRIFANNPSSTVHQALGKNLIQMYKSGVNINDMLPTIIKLSASPNSATRTSCLDVFQEIYMKDISKFDEFLTIIFSLTQNRNPEVRKDAVETLIKVSFMQPDYVRSGKGVFTNLQILARDRDFMVKKSISKNLGKLFEIFPTRYETMLGIIYEFIRIGDGRLLDDVDELLRNIIKAYPDQNLPIKLNLQKNYNKSKNPVVLAILYSISPKKRVREKTPEQLEEERIQKVYHSYEDLYDLEPPFNLSAFEKFGRPRIISEILLYIMFAVFFAYGIYNLYYVGGYVRDIFSGITIDLTGYEGLLQRYLIIMIVIIVFIYVLSFIISYIVVRVFANLAKIMMYGNLILQLVICGLLVYYLKFEFVVGGYTIKSWIFALLAIPDVLLLTVFNKKFEKAIHMLKMSCLAVWKERQMLIPQFFQSLLIALMVFFYAVVTMGTFFELNQVGTTVVTIGERTLEITDNIKFWAYTVLFVFLEFETFFVTLGIKQLMVHHWYRGASLSFGTAFKIIRRRWLGLMGYAFSAAIIHLIQFTVKLFKGEIKIQNVGDVINLTKTVSVEDQQAFDKKKKVPWYERMFMALNYFTMPAIMIENKLYHEALWRSFVMIKHNIVDLFIKGAHVNVVFKVIQYTMVVSIGMIGALLGGLFAWYFDLNVYYGVALAIPLFFIVGGSTCVLILNDLNTAYITIMYIHTVDDLNHMKGYTRYELPKEMLEQINSQSEATAEPKEFQKEVKVDADAKIEEPPKPSTDQKEPNAEKPSESSKPFEEPKKD